MKPIQSISGLLASSLAAASLLAMPAVPLVTPLGVTAAVAVVGLAAPAPADAKPKRNNTLQAFAGPRTATRTKLTAKTPQDLKKKVVKFCKNYGGHCYATEYVQNLRTGQWRPAPYSSGTKVLDQFGNNLYQIR